MWSEVACYLDGFYHLGAQRKRDEEADAGLKKRGIRVLRFPYTPPLSQKKQRETVAQVAEAVNHSHRSFHASQ